MDDLDGRQVRWVVEGPMETETSGDAGEVWREAHMAIAHAIEAVHEAQLVLRRARCHEEKAWKVWQDEKKRVSEYEQTQGT